MADERQVTAGCVVVNKHDEDETELMVTHADEDHASVRWEGFFDVLPVSCLRVLRTEAEQLAYLQGQADARLAQEQADMDRHLREHAEAVAASEKRIAIQESRVKAAVREAERLAPAREAAMAEKLAKAGA